MTLRDSKVATRLPAQDLDRARAFYAKQLGLEPVEERPGGLLYRVGGCEFGLFASTGRASGEHTQMGFEVADIEATVAEFRARGVVFEDVDVPGLRTRDGIADIEGNYPSRGTGDRGAWFRDSEGNMLGIGQPVGESVGPRPDHTMASAHTHLNFNDVEDAAPAHGFGDRWEARVARVALEAEQTGVSHFRLRAGKRSPFSHRHTHAEEVYVILSGTGKVKLGGKISEVRPLDAIRVAPQVARAFEAGPDGLEFLAVGAHHPGDGEPVDDEWIT